MAQTTSHAWMKIFRPEVLAAGLAVTATIYDDPILCRDVTATPPVVPPAILTPHLEREQSTDFEVSDYEAWFLAACPSVNSGEADESEVETLAPSPAADKSFAERLTEHLGFLKRVSTEGERPPISLETAALARDAWWRLWIESGLALPIPSACTGPDGQILYVWDRGRHHLELEFVPGKLAEFFYRDRETEQYWGEDYRVGDPLPAEAAQKLKLFI